MSSALGGNQGVNLVDDDGFDATQGFGCLGGENQIERLGCGDENVGGLTAKAGTLLLRSVARCGR